MPEALLPAATSCGKRSGVGTCKPMAGCLVRACLHGDSAVSSFIASARGVPHLHHKADGRSGNLPDAIRLGIDGFESGNGGRSAFDVSCLLEPDGLGDGLRLCGQRGVLGHRQRAGRLLFPQLDSGVLRRAGRPSCGSGWSSRVFGGGRQSWRSPPVPRSRLPSAEAEAADGDAAAVVRSRTGGPDNGDGRSPLLRPPAASLFDAAGSARPSHLRFPAGLPRLQDHPPCRYCMLSTSWSTTGPLGIECDRVRGTTSRRPWLGKPSSRRRTACTSP